VESFLFDIEPNQNKTENKTESKKVEINGTVGMLFFDLIIDQ